jgi:Fe-S cluster assembly ATP-binding protein
MAKLEIKNLHVKVADKFILNDVNLTIEDGEVVALLGPNGHGKSTLLNAIMGNPNYIVTEGEILLDGQNVLEMTVDARSRAGLFLGMQAPSEVPGVVNADFIRAALNARSDKPVSPIKLFRLIEKASKEMNMPLDLSNRNLNEGFSGGEKKRNEILQMKLLKPTFAMLDEIDSGLDVDGIKIIADQINNEKSEGRSFLVISHYARLYDLIHPTRAIVMINGQIVVDSEPSVIQRIDTEGYDWIAREKGIKIFKEENKVTTLGSCAVKESI